MQKTLKALSLIGKGAGFVVAVNWTSINPKWGLWIFFGASLLKDTVNRIGDFLDDGKENQSFHA